MFSTATSATVRMMRAWPLQVGQNGIAGLGMPLRPSCRRLRLSHRRGGLCGQWCGQFGRPPRLFDCRTGPPLDACCRRAGLALLCREARRRAGPEKTGASSTSVGTPFGARCRDHCSRGIHGTRLLGEVLVGLVSRSLREVGSAVHEDRRPVHRVRPAGRLFFHVFH